MPSSAYQAARQAEESEEKKRKFIDEVNAPTIKELRDIRANLEEQILVLNTQLQQAEADAETSKKAAKRAAIRSWISIGIAIVSVIVSVILTLVL